MEKLTIFRKFILILSILLLPVSAFALKNEKVGSPVTFQTSDGVIIYGTYQPPAGPGMKTFVLLHGLGSTNEEWNTFGVRLARAGYGYLSYDARGHGKSTFTKSGKQISYENFTKEQWNRMVSDVGDAINFLVNEKKLKAGKIGLMGASIGANISLLYATSNETVPMVILLSPGVNYVVFNISGAINSFKKRPVAIAASPNDNYAFQSSQLLFKQIQSNPRASMITGEKGHGVDMFAGNKFMKELFTWIRNN